MAIETQLTDNQVLKAKSQDLVLTVYKDGAATAVSGASCILYDSGTTEKATPTPVVSGDNNEIITVTVEATVYTEIEDDCRIEWTFTADSKTIVTNSLFDVVNYKVYNPVITADLLAMHPEIDDDQWTDQSNFQNQIDEAYEDFLVDVRNKGTRGAWIVDMSQIKRPIKYKSLSIIFKSFIKQSDDVWEKLFILYSDMYDSELAKTRFKYDATGDGAVDTVLTLGTVHFGR